MTIIDEIEVVLPQTDSEWDEWAIFWLDRVDEDDDSDLTRFALFILGHGGLI